MIKKIFAGLLLVIALNYTVKSQNLNTAKLDSFFSALTTHNKNMGSLAISSDGMVVYQKAIGYSQVNGEAKTAATIKTKYRIGSISKMFTAVMVFQLIEEGKLSLKTTLATWYPNYLMQLK